MAESPIETSKATEPQVEKTSRLKNFTVNHPRTAKVVGIVAVTVGTLGVISAVKARKQAANSTEAGTADAPFDASSETN